MTLMAMITVMAVMTLMAIFTVKTMMTLMTVMTPMAMMTMMTMMTTINPDDHDDHDDHDDPDGHTDRNDHDDSRDDSLDKESDLRAARARDCFHLPRGNQRILRGQKANVQLANTGGQKFAENKEPESKRIHHCQKATIWKAPILCIYD
ncbi:hypothetical protein CAPTEDRAFT_213526 [Capitella teleta]|uniref:Uncharacterized protein n=1 Tax=Capitella teleta TaxID=283909 RepID=R7VKT9_CAPTE|nr:hypothetical protein CAPTEDRAFT_213526 [Capitella teleta]|eukprot:ELU17055.1 hypothetical protein CAPTEDRAFT_213526 [Capitella teleta]